MTILTPDEREALDRALRELREELRALLSSSEEGAKPVSLDEPIGRLSRMDALQQQSMVRASRQQAKQRLAQVDAALRRVEEGGYGECLACEEPIGAPRLTARPEAPLCIACQSQREQARS